MPGKVITAWISKDVIKRIVSKANETFPKETGGVLMGFWSDPYDEVVIHEMIGPGPEAIHSESKFEPDALYQEKEIAYLYEKSGRLHTYLGDWHTHPLSTVTQLSRRDRRTLKRIAVYKEARTPIPIMTVLAGIEKWKLNIWKVMPMCLGKLVFGLRVSAFSVRIF